MKIAVDIGFGSTKVVHNNSYLKFPSAISKLKSSQADIDHAEVLEFNGSKYVVGDNAVRNALTTKDYYFLEKYSPLLLYKAFELSKIDTTKNITLATGLSLMHWSKRTEFAEMLTDFIVNKARVNVSVKLIPQGKGIYLDYIAEHHHLLQELVLVVDIGYNTLDVIPFEHGKALASEAWASPQGVNLMVDEIRKRLSNEYNFSFTEARVNNIMQKKLITIDGEDRDISLLINEEQENYHEIIINELITRNPDVFRSAKAIIMAGGGAYYFEDNVAKNIVHTLTPYEYSNVRGYYRSLGE